MSTGTFKPVPPAQATVRNSTETGERLGPEARSRLYSLKMESGSDPDSSIFTSAKAACVLGRTELFGFSQNQTQYKEETRKHKPPPACPVVPDQSAG